jgi:hypothetical protein
MAGRMSARSRGSAEAPPARVILTIIVRVSSETQSKVGGRKAVSGVDGDLPGAARPCETRNSMPAAAELSSLDGLAVLMCPRSDVRRVGRLHGWKILFGPSSPIGSFVYRLQ